MLALCTIRQEIPTPALRAKAGDPYPCFVYSICTKAGDPHACFIYLPRLENPTLTFHTIAGDNIRLLSNIHAPPSHLR